MRVELCDKEIDELADDRQEKRYQLGAVSRNSHANPGIEYLHSNHPIRDIVDMFSEPIHYRRAKATPY